MKLARLTSTLILLLIIGSSLTAGDLSQNLRPVIDNSQPDEMIRVWIKLNRVEPAGTLKAAINNLAASAAERHRFGIQKLKNDHARAQERLVNRLGDLERNARAQNVKQHWIANVISAEVAAGELETLAARDDIDRIYAVPKISLIAPHEDPGGLSLSPLRDTITPNLEYIRANVAWGMGYTGAGSIICSFDTGVEGNHPALYDRWKGHDGDSAAAWFEPRGGSKFPQVISDCGFTSCNSGHGTHTMGLACGYDPATNTNVGVAPGASWISAAIIDIAGVNILEAFEWAADPDRNPNTADDVPDVINHSWGYENAVIECENVFYDAIDNTEALGIVNVFAAGNQAGDSSVFNPANGDRDSLDCFAVGNITLETNPPTLYFSSSQGPSDCRGGIKPNVVAVGRSVYSCYPPDTYTSGYTGTSMAAPQVAGLVALLRQKNPNATVDEVKEAILAGAHGETTFPPLPNNEVGWGAIDCVASLDSLSAINATPNIRVYDFTHDPISPGDTVEGTLVLQNLGATVNTVQLMLDAGGPGAPQILNGTASFGTIAEGDTVRSGNIIRVVIPDTTTGGSILSLDAGITGIGYMAERKLYFLVEPMREKAMITHDIGSIEFTVTNYGLLGLGPNAMYRGGGAGFSFNGGVSDLFEAGVMIGTGPTRVSSTIHDYVDRPTYDFSVAPGGNMVYLQPSPEADEHSFSAFSDYNADFPLGLIIRQESMAYATGDYVLLKYTLENPTASAINNVYLGLYLDWDCYSNSDPNYYAHNAGGFDDPGQFAWQAYNTGAGLTRYRGSKLVKGPLAGVHTANSPAVGYIKFWGGNGYTTAEKWSSLIHGFTSAEVYKDSSIDLFQVTSAGPLDVPVGGSVSVMFALLAGNTFPDIQSAASMAQATDSPWDAGDPIVPGTFQLLQNSPNPFNPSTRIAFDLPQAAEYRLSIYNVLGQEVYTQTAKAPAGRVEVTWRADDHASGIYLYKVTAGEFSASKKMLLLK